MKYFTIPKVSIYCLIVIIFFYLFDITYIEFRSDIITVIVGFCIFFIQDRIKSLISVIGIVNSTMDCYVNLMDCGCCKNGKIYSRKYDKSNSDVKMDIISSYRRITEIIIWDNNFSHFLYKVRMLCENDAKIDFNYFSFSSSDKNGKSSARLKTNFNLIRELIKIF